MWCVLTLLLHWTSTAVLVDSKISVMYGNETRRQNNTSKTYTVVTSFTKSTENRDALNDKTATFTPVTVNIYPTEERINNDGRSNITQPDEKIGNSSKIVTISTVDAQATNASNKTSYVNNSVLENALFPIIHASMIATKANNSLNKGKVGSNTDIIQGSRNIIHTNTVKNSSSALDSFSPFYQKLKNSTNFNHTSTTTTGKLVNYTNPTKDPENNTLTPANRNDNKLLNNSVGANAFLDTQRGKSTIKSKNGTDTGNMWNYTNPKNTSSTAISPVPVPIVNPITNNVVNTVTNEVVNPFNTAASSPVINRKPNTTEFRTNKLDVDDSIIDFPNASSVMSGTEGLHNVTNNVMHENNTKLINTSRDSALLMNTTRPAKNSVPGNIIPSMEEAGNATAIPTNQTKPVISSVFMEALPPFRKLKSSTNLVSNSTKPGEASAPENNSSLAYDVPRDTYRTVDSGNPANSSFLSSVLPMSPDMRNGTNVKNYSTESQDNFMDLSTSPTVHEARNITTNVNGQRNTTNVKTTSATMPKVNGNPAETRSINFKAVTEYTEADPPISMMGETRPVNHVTVIGASETTSTKSTEATPQSEMMDANTVHPTALMEYYELRDDGTDTCDGRTDGTYALQDVTKYLKCVNHQVQIIPCGGDLVYDVNVQQCVERISVNKDRFCTFRGDGMWDSPWNPRMKIHCNKGFITSEGCKYDLHYDPNMKDCIQENLFVRCFSPDGDYTNAKLGCYRKRNLKMDMLINDLPGSRGEHILDWRKFADSVESLVCRCSKEAYSKGYPFFAIRLWAECWAGRNRTELKSLLADESQKNEQFCYSNITIAAFDKCTDSDTRVCVGSEHGQYLYEIVNVTAVNMGATPFHKNAQVRSKLDNQIDFVDLVSLRDLQKIQNTGKLQLIDVREGFEYDGVGSIKDSINIPLHDLANALLLSDRSFEAKYGIKKPLKDDCNIVFLCSSGVRSDMAYKIAKDIGYKCPKSLKGGFDLLPKIPIQQ